MLPGGVCHAFHRIHGCVDARVDADAIQWPGCMLEYAFVIAGQPISSTVLILRDAAAPAFANAMVAVDAIQAMVFIDRALVAHAERITAMIGFYTLQCVFELEFGCWQ